MTGDAYRAALVAIVDAQARVFHAQAELANAHMQLGEAYQQWSQLPATLALLIDGKEPQGMPSPVNDVQFMIDVIARDAAGRSVPDPDALTYTVCDTASDLTTQNPSGAATLGPDPNFPGDNSHQQVSVTPADASGNQQSFKLFVTDGTRSAISDQLDPTPGGPTTLTIGVSQT